MGGRGERCRLEDSREDGTHGAAAVLKFVAFSVMGK